MGEEAEGEGQQVRSSIVLRMVAFFFFFFFLLLAGWIDKATGQRQKLQRFIVKSESKAR